MSAPHAAVLDHYAPAFDGFRWEPVSGGFSGARVWRGDNSKGQPVFALKAWPKEMTTARLSQVHLWQAQGSHLSFIPGVVATANRRMAVTEAGCLWDANHWMPGAAIAEMTTPEVEVACVAIARLHSMWPVEKEDECPGVRNRLRILADLSKMLASDFKLPSTLPQSLTELLRRATLVVATARPWAERALAPLRYATFPLRPCVRDLRAEHVLFTAGSVTGLIDFGACAVDHPAVDLARFLGDAAGTGGEQFAAGLRAYRQHCSDWEVPDEFVHVLDRTGAVCSVVGWLQRLVVERRNAGDLMAVENRLRKLVIRVENLNREMGNSW